MDKRVCVECKQTIEWTEQMIGKTCMLCSRNHESMKRLEAEARVTELKNQLNHSDVEQERLRGFIKQMTADCGECGTEAGLKMKIEELEEKLAWAKGRLASEGISMP
jgi:hypothetical protein